MLADKSSLKFTSPLDEEESHLGNPVMYTTTPALTNARTPTPIGFILTFAAAIVFLFQLNFSSKSTALFNRIFNEIHLLTVGMKGSDVK